MSGPVKRTATNKALELLAANFIYERDPGAEAKLRELLATARNEFSIVARHDPLVREANETLTAPAFNGASDG
jgi:hypothetical protein